MPSTFTLSLSGWPVLDRDWPPRIFPSLTEGIFTPPPGQNSPLQKRMGILASAGIPYPTPRILFASIWNLTIWLSISGIRHSSAPGSPLQTEFFGRKNKNISSGRLPKPKLTLREQWLLDPGKFLSEDLGIRISWKQPSYPGGFPLPNFCGEEPTARIMSSIKRCARPFGRDGPSKRTKKFGKGERVGARSHEQRRRGLDATRRSP